MYFFITIVIIVIGKVPSSSSSGTLHAGTGGTLGAWSTLSRKLVCVWIMFSDKVTYLPSRSFVDT